MGEEAKDFWIAVMRYFFGIHFFFNGTNGFFRYLALPPADPTSSTAVFVTAMDKAGLLFEGVKIIETVGGLLLLLNLYVPLALVVCMPVSVVVALLDVDAVGDLVGGRVHGASNIFKSLNGVTTALINGLLLLAYFKYYRPFLTLRSTPGIRPEHSRAEPR